MALVEQKQYEKGIELLTKALKVRQSPLWLLSRCKAYQNTKRLDEALADADLAYVLATERQGAQSQAQRAEAQYRRAVIYYKKGHFADSDACCVWSMQILEGRKFISSEDDVAGNVDSNGQYRATVEDAKNRKSMLKESAPGSGAGQPNESRPDWARAYVWRTQALTAMEALGQGDPGRKLTAQRVPAKPVFDEGLETKPKVKEVVSENKLEAGDVVTSAPKAAAGAPKPKLRVDFYQTDKTVNLTLYIKGVVKDELKVTENDTTVRLFNSCTCDRQPDSYVDRDPRSAEVGQAQRDCGSPACEPNQTIGIFDLQGHALQTRVHPGKGGGGRQVGILGLAVGPVGHSQLRRLCRFQEGPWRSRGHGRFRGRREG